MNDVTCEGSVGPANFAADDDPVHANAADIVITEGLVELAAIQAHGARHLPEHLHPHDDADFRTAALGAFVELGELVNVCQWKPWRSYAELTGPEHERILDEFADLLHFIAWIVNNLHGRYGITELDLAQAFIEKAKENRRRFTGQVPGREPPSPRSS